MKMTGERLYAESGLDSVYISVPEGTEGIPAAGCLHEEIVRAVCTRFGRLTAKEIRFLRSECGLGIKDMARLCHTSFQHWQTVETGTYGLQGAHEAILRMLACEHCHAAASPKHVAGQVCGERNRAPDIHMAWTPEHGWMRRPEKTVNRRPEEDGPGHNPEHNPVPG